MLYNTFIQVQMESETDLSKISSEIHGRETGTTTQPSAAALLVQTRTRGYKSEIQKCPVCLQRYNSNLLRWKNIAHISHKEYFNKNQQAALAMLACQILFFFDRYSLARLYSRPRLCSRALGVQGFLLVVGPSRPRIRIILFQGFRSMCTYMHAQSFFRFLRRRDFFGGPRLELANA